MGKILAFANQKGGVGKTTSAVNVASSLGVLGYKTLLVDLDPQGNATTGLGILKRSLTKTVAEVLTSDTKASEVMQKTVFDNLYILPASLTLAGAEPLLNSTEDSQSVLKEKLEEIKQNFDYIILDCPPSLGMLTVNALVSADGVVIPMQSEFFALEGIAQLSNIIRRVKQRYNEKLYTVGILLTMYNKRSLLSVHVVEELRKHYNDKPFETTISRSVKLAEAPSFGQPIYYYDKASKSAQEYLAVSKEIAERI